MVVSWLIVTFCAVQTQSFTSALMYNVAIRSIVWVAACCNLTYSGNLECAASSVKWHNIDAFTQHPCWHVLHHSDYISLLLPRLPKLSSMPFIGSMIVPSLDNIKRPGIRFPLLVMYRVWGKLLVPWTVWLPSSHGYLVDEKCVWIAQTACIFVWCVCSILPWWCVSIYQGR